jgi:hypothetical protein
MSVIYFISVNFARQSLIQTCVFTWNPLTKHFNQPNSSFLLNTIFVWIKQRNDSQIFLSKTKYTTESFVNIRRPFLQPRFMTNKWQMVKKKKTKKIRNWPKLNYRELIKVILQWNLKKGQNDQRKYNLKHFYPLN